MSVYSARVREAYDRDADGHFWAWVQLEPRSFGGGHLLVRTPPGVRKGTVVSVRPLGDPLFDGWSLTPAVLG